MAVSSNIDIFCWLIKQLYSCSKIKEIHTKDMSLISALIELPVSFVKEGSRYTLFGFKVPFCAAKNPRIVGYFFCTKRKNQSERVYHGVLLENYLNSSFLCHRPIADMIDADSIVVEKIAK